MSKKGGKQSKDEEAQQITPSASSSTNAAPRSVSYVSLPEPETGRQILALKRKRKSRFNKEEALQTYLSNRFFPNFSYTENLFSGKMEGSSGSCAVSEFAHLTVAKLATLCNWALPMLNASAVHDLASATTVEFQRSYFKNVKIKMELINLIDREANLYICVIKSKKYQLRNPITSWDDSIGLRTASVAGGTAKTSSSVNEWGITQGPYFKECYDMVSGWTKMTLAPSGGVGTFSYDTGGLYFNWSSVLGNISESGDTFAPGTFWIIVKMVGQSVFDSSATTDTMSTAPTSVGLRTTAEYDFNMYRTQKPVQVRWDDSTFANIPDANAYAGNPVTGLDAPTISRVL